MASQPPMPETTVPGEAPQPTTPPMEAPAPGEDVSPTPGGDIDVPAPQPGGEPSTGSPLGMASASRAGVPTGEDDGIGSTDTMTASTGGMAGTSR